MWHRPQGFRGNTDPEAPFGKMPPRQARSRGWCFTVNNPTLGDELGLSELKEAADYVIYGEEVGESGTPHYQGYAHFKFPQTLTRVRGLLERAHWEPQRGTTNQAIEYCKKDGHFHESGEPPKSAGDKSKELWRAVIAAAERGDMEWIKCEQPGIYLRFHERLRTLRTRTPTILRGSVLPHEWWYGPTGTGKSRTVWDLYPAHFQKELNKWWDGYEDEDVVVIEEWSPKNECTASFLKIWADRYPFTGQIKGGTLHKIRPKKIIVTSNYTIEECFPDPQDHLPLLRRFKVKHFSTFFQPRPPLTDDIIDEILL